MLLPRLCLSKTLFPRKNKIQNHKNQDMCLIFIPRPAPTGARNRGYRCWFRQEPGGVSRGTGSPWKCAELLRHTQRDMCLIFIPRPAPTGARNQGYRRWFRQKPGGVSRGYWIPPGSVPNSFGTLRRGRSQVLLPRLYFRARVFLFIQQASFLMSSRIRTCCPPGQLNRLQTNGSVLN